MRDRLFFPLAFILASAFIFMALQPFAERLPTGPVSGGGRNVEDITVKDDELHRFLPGQRDSIKFIRGVGDQPAVLRITRPAADEYQDPRSGPHLVLAEDIEYALQKRSISIEIEARSAGDFPASRFEANYFAKAEHETGWKLFDLTSEFKTYTFEYEPPPLGEAMGYDFIGIRPVAPDKYRVMDIRSVRVRAISPMR